MWDDFKSLVQILGVPGAMLAVALYVLYRGWFLPIGTVIRERQMYDSLLTRERVISEERIKDLLDRFERMREEKDMWRNMALGHLEVAERATNALGDAMSKIPDKPVSTGGA